jgi:hypothetical protein
MVFTSRNTVWLIVFIALAVFVESSIPYKCAERNAPAGYQFSGQVSYAPDQNMYFSFISQARDGAFLMNNKLTATPNKPVFLNLEYWLVGYIQHLTGMSENAVYQVWRLLGAALLAIGFYMLTLVVLPAGKRRLAAFAAFFCTGGFGFAFVILSELHLTGFDVTHMGMIDMRYGMLPLQQIICNPHMSLPHGLILLAYTFFIMGERYGLRKYYVYSGLVFVIIGLVRPYDLIPPVIIFPLYAVVLNRGLRFQLVPLLWRMLPLVMIVPVFMYNVWLFKYNEIFKYWSLQGHNADALPGPLWHYMAYGVVGTLAIVRLIQARKYPPGKIGTFVLLWFGVTFVFIHLGKYIPDIGWSPQIGVYLAAPLTLAACMVGLDGLKESMLKYAVLPGIVGLVFISNVFVVMYHTRKFVGKVKTEIFYTSNAEMDAFVWLREHTAAGSVVLADNLSSQRIAKYTSNRVVAAHYSVTPRFVESDLLAGSLLTDSLILSGEKPLPAESNISYIYTKTGQNMQLPITGNYLREVYRNNGVVVYGDCKVE